MLSVFAAPSMMETEDRKRRVCGGKNTWDRIRPPFSISDNRSRSPGALLSTCGSRSREKWAGDTAEPATWEKAEWRRITNRLPKEQVSQIHSVN
ncbi:hypothetical protein SKAU_G00288860 [Synaphobranchus kaupii]|uniref:Uncharacterized protein n=1 Tax=Synaphobranchus kaupii TaxID=118154 RepID=A0A9Q1ETF5_SYNKA|nr:hypothetical protein SKAU_G00288860 [Synaphobranchus kaupii]